MRRLPWSETLAMLLPCALFSLAVGGCGTRVPDEPPPSLDEAAESYIRLVLAVGQHDDGYVDAYYGPEAWREEAVAAAMPLAEIHAEADKWSAAVAAAPAAEEEIVALRRRYLARQLEALIARVDMLAGVESSFDEESRALYDAVAPTLGEEHFQQGLDQLDERLATEGFSEGSLIERYDAFRKSFVIPPDRLDEVFRAAIEACRQRTAAHLDLPTGESFEIEYVQDKPWSAYNWYKGGYHSLIQVNIDLPIYIDRAIDLACHEGYPGHHVYNALLEKHLVDGRGWREYSVYPLYSPQSLIAEGSANYGIEMAFPGDERLHFEKAFLYPLAGLDPERAAAYDAVQKLVESLSYAGPEAARRYLDGEIDAQGAVDWLTRFAVMSPARAEQRVRFFDNYRSYVINYTLGQDLVRAHVEALAGQDQEARWQIFGELLSSPRLPSGLQ